MARFFTADQHFGHYNVIRHCNRPFIDVNEMDAFMIDAINKKIGVSDTLFHLGDFVHPGRKPPIIQKYREQIRCRDVILIIGNHDPAERDGRPKAFLNDLFSRVYQNMLIRLGGKQATLSHYPYETWPKHLHGAYHLHGHSHGGSSKRRNRLDVGVDCHNFAPLSEDEVLVKLMENPDE